MSHRFAMTRRDLATVERAVRDAHHMLSRDPGYSDAKPLHAPSKMHVKGALTQTAEVFSSSLVFGALQGRFGAWGLGPVPGNVISGLVMHGLAMFGLGGPDYAHHLHNLGDGALASYSTTLGTQLGNMWRLKSGGSPFSAAVTVASTAGVHGIPARRLRGPWEAVAGPCPTPKCRASCLLFGN